MLNGHYQHKSSSMLKPIHLSFGRVKISSHGWWMDETNKVLKRSSKTIVLLWKWVSHVSLF